MNLRPKICHQTQQLLSVISEYKNNQHFSLIQTLKIMYCIKEFDANN